MSLQQIQQQTLIAAQQFSRNPQDIKLIAVSKMRSCEEILQAYHAGQHAFGENYVQEALPKITALQAQSLEWHFIGPIQSNKCKAIAQNFAWVHSVDRLKIAQLLNEHRPATLGPLQVCIQINISDESSKSGVAVTQVKVLTEALMRLPNLKLRGFMVIPAVLPSFQQQRLVFHRVKQLLETINQQLNLQLDTLSMGMSDDYIAAIAEGATMIRLGTAIFGKRG